VAYREPVNVTKKPNPFLGIAKKAREDRENIDNLLTTIVAELNEAIAEDLGPVAVLSVANDVLTIQSRKTGQSTAIKLPIRLCHDGYNINTILANRSSIENYLTTELVRGSILDALIRILRGA
jgi:alpha-glucuronidase